jgi:pyruvate/2-oxoglutarate dehydrogenase complex dihydrolipoamide dehydrogenase (E3) component
VKVLRPTDAVVLEMTTNTRFFIVGGGPVGVEFATAFTALGIPVTLVSQTERLLPSMDGELAGLMADEFERRGVRLILGAGADAVARLDGQLTVTLTSGAVLATDVVLFAAGRTPNTEDLGLAGAGVQLDARGGSSSTATTARPPRGSTPRATWSVPRSPRVRCGRGARPRATPSAWCLASRWIRPRVRRSTACPRSPE